MKILKPIQSGLFLIFANGKSIQDGMQTLVYTQNSNFGQFLPLFGHFWSKPGNFPGKR